MAEQQYHTEEERMMIDKAYNEMLQVYLSSSHRGKVEIIEKAMRFATNAHQGVRRRSGEPYIMHPIAVATIVAKEIGMGSTSICSALLHDVVEDTEYTVEDLENIFGKKIAQIVDGLTKISGGVFGKEASAQAENFRKLLLTMSEDIRVVLIKIADRLHNMRTLQSMPPAKQFKIAGETQYIYAPLANRLGLYAIKTELEDLSFKYEHPEKYDMLQKLLEKDREERESLFTSFAQPIRKKLEEMGCQFEILGRVKSIYSIWRKMQAKNIPFEEVYDLLALRIIFDLKEGEDEKSTCWAIYSAVTDVYKPHPERTRDWVSTPKSNGYEALHVTVMGPHGQWIEVQIRSRRMDDIAEKGFAAHWKYKTGEKDDSELEKWLQTIKELLENPEPNAIDFLDTFKLNLFASEIFVFTPTGEIKTLPQGATALDFAFFLHTDMGMHCIGAKVNHKLVPLSYVLKSGDQVEILTSKKQAPEPEWISYVVTARAKGKLRSLFKKEYKTFIAKGEHDLKVYLEDNGQKMSPDNLSKVMDYFKEVNKEELFYKIGKSVYNLSELSNGVFKTQNKWLRYWNLTFKKDGKSTSLPFFGNKKVDTKKTLTLDEEKAGLTYRIADCCQPIPGDDILGFMEEDGMLSVHKRQCPVAMKLKSNYGERIISAVWETHKMLSFPATIELKGVDRLGVLCEIIRTITEEHAINISKLNVDTKDGIFELFVTLNVHDVEDVNNLCMALMKNSNVSSVNRVELNMGGR
jgi:GTP pyrophosphokinase